jgi:hypothetical protein
MSMVSAVSDLESVCAAELVVLLQHFRETGIADACHPSKDVAGVTWKATIV